MKRFFLVVTVLAGLFAMHGFTGGKHQVGIPDSHSSMGSGGSDAVMAMAMDVASGANGAVDAAGLVGTDLAIGIPDHGGSHDMGSLCLAILTGFFLFGFGLFLSLGVARVTDIFLSYGTNAVRRRPPVLRKPTLTFLCVSRT